MIPYDFDYSAVVSPSYARINPDYAVKDFRDRIYLGQYFDDLLPQVLDEYVQARQIILDHVDNFPDLKSARKKWIRNYIEDFYEFIESPDTVLAYKVILPYEE